jgi:hypothetical protein
VAFCGDPRYVAFQPVQAIPSCWVSGVPNHPDAAQIVGYGEGINPMTFRIDDDRGTIVAPASIGHLNYFTVLVFARNAEAVGWKQFILVHAAAPDLPEP